MKKSSFWFAKRSFVALTAIGLMGGVGCDFGVGFLGLEDYQRDLLVGGLLAGVLLNGDGDTGAEPAATQGVPGADGADGVAGSPGVDGRQGDPGADGVSGDAGPEGPAGATGPAGPVGARGPSGTSGGPGSAGAGGFSYFTIFVDDFFTLGGNPTGDLQVNEDSYVTISEPVLGPSDAGDCDNGDRGDACTAVAYRVAIPEAYTTGNDVTMRLSFLRTGEINDGRCFVFSLDAARLRSGEPVLPYGETVWVRVDWVRAEGETSDRTFVVVDLVINSSTANGLNYPELAISDLLAFELATYWGDGAEYHLLGVEFYEFLGGSAESANATLFATGDDVVCDCEGNGLDCNENNIPDNCDIEFGTSDDCQPNGIPDECEADCNENGIPDDCDIADETSQDCQPNGIPDECERGGTDCEVVVFTVVNINAAVHGPPDLGFSTVDVALEAGNWELVLVRPESEPNATFTAWSFSFGNPGTWGTNWSAQLNDESLIPGGTFSTSDSFEEAWDATTNFVTKLKLEQANTLRFHIRDDALTDNRGGVSVLIRNQCIEPGGGDPGDCNVDGILDECQIEGNDCNGNGILDECDINIETSMDCQPNGIPDECDIALGRPAAPARGTGQVAVGAIQIDPFYAGVYTLADLGAVPGVPPSYGGLTLKFDDANTLLIGGNANIQSGALYSIPVIRDGNNHITGFTGAATVFAEAAFNDGGVVYGPEDVLFLARWPANEVGQTKPGSTVTDKIIDLGPLGVVPSPGGLSFVPPGLPGAGQLKMVSWVGGEWYSLSFTADGSGTFDITAASMRTTLGGGPEGIAYVPAGSPLFESPSVLVSEFSANTVATYEVDAAGDPVVATRRNFISGLGGAEGAFIDPFTGDFLFSTFGGGDRVIVVQGFTAPEPPGSRDCNDNGVPDECDIADGTSEDCNENGVPDECDGGCESLTGWWRVEFEALAECETGLGNFVVELRYLRFDENNELVENFIMEPPLQRGVGEDLPRCLQIFYPSDDGPNYVEALFGDKLTLDTHREIMGHSFDTSTGGLSLTELVDVPDRMCIGEEGFTIINAQVSGDSMTGTWEFQFNEDTGFLNDCGVVGQLCGPLAAQRVEGPEECDLFNPK